MSFLAQRYDEGKSRFNSEDIARGRNLPKPLVAKLLTTLSTAGLVNGTRGPGGGYWLAKPPSEISLADIAARFEKEQEAILCPFGPGWCGNNDPCPVHDDLFALNEQWNNFLVETTLAVFAVS